MVEDIAKKWVKALRSGKYKQAYLRLHDAKTGGFCCLGVLCKLFEADYEGMDKRLIENHTLPLSVMKDFNIVTSVCATDKKVVIGNGRYLSLAAANDNHESFADIANCIEANYALL